MDKSLLLLNQRPAERAGTRPVYYAIKQQLLLYREGEWRIGRSKQHFSKEFEQEEVEGDVEVRERGQRIMINAFPSLLVSPNMCLGQR